MRLQRNFSEGDQTAAGLRLLMHAGLELLAGLVVTLIFA